MNLNGRINNRKILVILAIIATILLSIFGLLFFLIHGSNAKPTYSFSGNNLTISGQYGVKINLSGATVTHELSQVPATPIHTNGAAIGNIEKGYFKLGSLSVYKNVMDKNASDYILITDNKSSEYYINCASLVETNNLFNEISKHNGFVE
jgi:hypothetical protein